MKKLLAGLIFMTSMSSFAYTIEDYKNAVLTNNPQLTQRDKVVQYAEFPLSQQETAKLIIEKLESLESGMSMAEVGKELFNLSQQTNDLEQRNVIRLIVLDASEKELKRLRESVENNPLPEGPPF